MVEQSVVTGVVAVLVTFNLFLYFGITTVLLCKLVVEGAETRHLLAAPLLPSFCQNYGIPLAVLGFAVRSDALSLVGALLIALAMLLGTNKTISLHPNVEAPLLTLALLALLGVGFVYMVY